MNKLHLTSLVFSCLLTCFGQVNADTVQDYPQAPLTAEQIAEQVYQVTHGKLLQSSSSKKHKKDISMVVTRPPQDKRKPGRMPTVNTFETYGKNNPEDPAIDYFQMAIITSGKVKGTGILYVSYTDENKGGIMSIWLPALRKIRRMNEPAHDEAWVGTNLTYGELVLRRPEHEVHELVGEKQLEDCLPAMELASWEVNRYTERLPEPQCAHKGKPVYLLKSTTKFKNWWYDYHISEIDKETFALYRTVYFKDDKKIKTVAVDWQSLQQADSRIVFPRYIYAVSHENGSDTLVFVPVSTITLNPEIPDSFWSEETLKTYGSTK